MRWREITDTQFAMLDKTGVAVLRQPFMPIPYFAAEQGVTLAFTVQPCFSDAVYLPQAFVKFNRGGVM